MVTAGDLTRLMEREEHFFTIAVSDVMTPQPKRPRPIDLAATAVGVMERAGIMTLPVIDAQRHR